MKYTPMRFDPDYRPYVAPECIYIIPLSVDPSRYRVVIPAALTRKLSDLAIQDRLVIRQFHGCPGEAAETVKAQLLRRLLEEPARYATRMNRLLIAGTALFVLGVINWTFPDPLPLVDEILLVAGGAATGIAAYAFRRRNLPLLRQKTGQAEGRLAALAGREDPLLTRIHESIQARNNPPREEAAHPGMDSIEAEAAWLLEYLNVEDLIDSGRVSREELRCLLSVLAGALPLDRLLRLEQHGRREPGNSRVRRLRDALAERCGLSGDALTVYCEFVRCAREILDSPESLDFSHGGGV